MAEYLMIHEATNYPLSTGEAVDLINLVSSSIPGNWVEAKSLNRLAIGTPAYVHALGCLRRGVVVKTTPTKVHIALTTQSAVDEAQRSSYSWGVRVRTVTADPNYVFIAPPAEPAPTMLSLDEMVQVERIAVRQRPTMSDARAEVMDTVEVLAGDLMTEDNLMTKNDFPRETTGSAVVVLLEKVWDRIIEDHPELPEVVLVTGSGLAGDNKWGHFRPDGWKTGAGGAAVNELFIAGETLAKGARQVLQTMLHEATHCLARVRDVKDTSRQGRWHNATFLDLAQQMGLEHLADKAHKTIGYSVVTLTADTIERYADLLAELDREIHLQVPLPSWLGGDTSEGGEKIGPRPISTGPTSGLLKLVCSCADPSIIRASRRVADLGTVTCRDCGSAFTEAVS